MSSKVVAYCDVVRRIVTDLLLLTFYQCPVVHFTPLTAVSGLLGGEGRALCLTNGHEPVGRTPGSRATPAVTVRPHCTLDAGQPMRRLQRTHTHTQPAWSVEGQEVT